MLIAKLGLFMARKITNYNEQFQNGASRVLLGAEHVSNPASVIKMFNRHVMYFTGLQAYFGAHAAGVRYTVLCVLVALIFLWQGGWVRMVRGQRPMPAVPPPAVEAPAANNGGDNAAEGNDGDANAAAEAEGNDGNDGALQDNNNAPVGGADGGDGADLADLEVDADGGAATLGASDTQAQDQDVPPPPPASLPRMIGSFVYLFFASLMPGLAEEMA